MKLTVPLRIMQRAAAAVCGYVALSFCVREAVCIMYKHHAYGTLYVFAAHSIQRFYVFGVQFYRFAESIVYYRVLSIVVRRN